MSGERRDTSLHQLLESMDAAQSTETAGWLANGVKQRLEQRQARRDKPTRRLLWVLPVAATMLLGAVWLRPQPSPDRIKGPLSSLALYRQTSSGSEQLADGSIAKPGDVVRVGYRVGAPGFGLIASVDDRGVVTVHYPTESGRAAELRDGDLVLLDQAYELDDAPERERFYLITAAAPFDVGPVISLIKREAASHDVQALPLPSMLAQSTFLLQKDSRP